jgi:putative cell wall-binding protein
MVPRSHGKTQGKQSLRKPMSRLVSLLTSNTFHPKNEKEKRMTESKPVIAPIIVALFAAAAIAFSFAQDASAQGDYISGYYILAGEDRYQTSVIVSQYGWPDGADVVYIASGDTFPDALSAASIASDGPVLLVPKDGLLPDAVHEEYRRLTMMRPTSVFTLFIGGNAAISPEMREQVLASRAAVPALP